MLTTIDLKAVIARAHEVTIPVQGKTTLTYDLYHVTRPEEIGAVCDWYDQQEMVGLDTETGGLDPWKDGLATVQLGNPLAEIPSAFVIDWRLFTLEQLKPLLERLASRKVRKLGQNIKFEYRFLKLQANCALRNLWDTQLAEQIVRAGLFSNSEYERDDSTDDEGKSRCYRDTSMLSLTRRYLEIDIDKDQDIRLSFYRTPAGTYSLRHLVYAAGDVIYPFYIWREQQQEIEARALRSIVELEMRTIPVTAEAELRGMRLDQAAWRQLYQEAEQGRLNTERKLHALLRNAQQQELFEAKPTDLAIFPKTEEPVNFDSTPQLKWAVSAYCEAIKWPYRIVCTKKELAAIRRRFGAEWLDYRFNNQRGTPLSRAEFMAEMVDRVPDNLIPETYVNLVKADKDALKLARVRKQLPREMVDLLLDYSAYSVRCDNFGVEFLNKHVKSDGRVHTEFHQGKASTGRYTTTPNLQNIPKDARYRKCFIPADGYKFVIADYSQQEPRLTAQESQDPVYLSTYLNDEDIYINVCEAMLGYRPDLQSSDPEFRARSERDRQIIKQVVLAMAYRMGAPKLWRKLCLALEKEILEGRMELPTYEYVKELHTNFLNTFSKLVEYQDYCSINASPTESPRPKIWDRYIDAPVTWATARCGRKRFFGPDAKGTFTAAANSPIQGCAASMSKAAAVLIQDYIDRHGIDAGVVDMVHDELVYECRADQAEQFAEVVRRLMEKAGKFYLPDVPIKAEFPKNTNGVVDYWAKEIKLEQAA